ncbi:MAG: tRNA uracil 4-sulfurtransferase ThiI [Anaerovoracaceae bacterium]
MIYIIRLGETALKGQNKPQFEKMTLARIKRLLKGIDGIRLFRREGLIFLETEEEANLENIPGKLKKAFGIASFSPAVRCDSNMEGISKKAIEYFKSISNEMPVTFKVTAKRADKGFPVKSPEIARIVGGNILTACPDVTVDVHNPKYEIFIDVRKDCSYIFSEKVKTAGGLPVGSNGKGMLLLSGGIDSPVAGYMMAKRGMKIEAVHFHSYPYTSERGLQQVKDLALQLSTFCGHIKLNIINLLPVQEQIVEKCPEDEMTIHIRRFMMRIAEELAIKDDCDMLITGESLGQVASQTSAALVVTDSVVSMPVMRPLIGLDKVEIMDIAREIDTFETSIKPFEDCCTVFLPKHPVTQPKKDRIALSESKLDIEKLVAESLCKVESVIIS